jgi:transposase
LDKDDISRLLGGWEGYVLGVIGRVESGTEGRKRPEIWIELHPKPDHPRRCSGCGEICTAIHDVDERWVRDLPILDADTQLLVHRVRVRCQTCGPKLEQLDWLDSHARFTRRLGERVAQLCAWLPIKQVAELYDLHWATVKRLDKERLQRTLGPPDLSGIEVIAMDEFAIQKGHRYATVIVEPRTKRVLWVGSGRRRDDVRPFFELLGSEGRERLKAVVMDMNGAYEEEVRAQCPQAEIVYDLFHVVVKYGREVIDRVRVDEANRLRDDKPARKVIKGARWLLLRNAENLPSETDRIRLHELLAANRKLATVYVLKDDLKELWGYRHEGYAWRFWQGWLRRAIHSRIEPLKTFARRLRERIDGVLAHCRWPLHTSLLEGINNKIKVIKRMAYGYRDHDYFFLKIRAAFPGIP